MSAQIHDSNTCNCEMCLFASKSALKPFQGYQRPSEGVNEALPSRQAAKTPLPATASTFEHDWNHAPSVYKRVTEREIAEYFYLCGVRAGRMEILTTGNEDLRELLRVARERVVN